jgi:nickel transport protein
MSNRIRQYGKALRGSMIVSLAMVQVLSLLLFTGATAHAHGVHIFAWVEGDTVYTDSYFSGNKKVKGGIVKVFDTSGAILLEGKTNDKGEYSFKLPGKTALRLVLEAGTGHRAECLLGADEIAGIEEGPAPPPSPSQEDRDHIRQVVEEALDAKLKPITRALAKIQEGRGPGLTDVIGGIGYIVGIMGIIIYFKRQKRS